MFSKPHHKLKWFSSFLTTAFTGSLLVACTNNATSATATKPKVNSDNHHQLGDNNPNDSSENPIAPMEQQLVETSFPELNDLNKMINLDTKFFTERDALTVYGEYQNKLNNLLPQLKIPETITKQFAINITHDSQTFADQTNGLIKFLKVTFTRGHQYENTYFELGGMKKHLLNHQDTSPKFTYLSQVPDLSQSIKNLYPSFVAQLLYYYSNLNNVNNEDFGDKLDYSAFLNHDPDLFTPSSKLTLGVGFLNNFFKTTEANETKYQYQVVGVKFDDLAGTVGVNVMITNREGSSVSEPDIQKTFEFSGLRTLASEQTHQNILSFHLGQIAWSTILKNLKPVTDMLKAHSNDAAAYDLTAHLQPEIISTLKSRIYKQIEVQVNDSTHNVYKQPEQNLKLTQLAALANGYSVYPYYSNYNLNSLFSSFKLTIHPDSSSSKHTLNLSATLNTSIYSTDGYKTLGDLFPVESGYLHYQLSATTDVNTLINSLN